MKYVILALFFVGCTAQKRADDVLRSVPEKLQKAESYHDYLDGQVGPLVSQIQEMYLRSPDQVCAAFAKIQTKDLLTYNEVLEGLREKVHCADGELKRIHGYYDDFQKRHPVTGNRRMATTVIVLDRAYSLPKEKPLPTKVINLTFDDGPHAVNTAKVLAALREFQIDANFFVLGQNATRYPTLIHQTADHGHLIGGHSMTHADLSKLSFDAARKEILGVFDVLDEILGESNPFFRFPYGARTKQLREFVANNNISDFFWDVDTLDWKYKDPEFLLKYALEQTNQTGRGIVLFHDIQPQTAAILPSYLAALSKLGYSTVVYHPRY